MYPRSIPFIREDAPARGRRKTNESETPMRPAPVKRDSDRRRSGKMNPDHAQGQASSVGVGVAALDADITDLLIALGDMPLLSPPVLEKLMQNHLDRDDHYRCITLPTSDGKRGNPVLWGKAFFPELAAMTGDSGGRAS